MKNILVLFMFCFVANQVYSQHISIIDLTNMLNSSSQEEKAFAGKIDFTKCRHQKYKGVIGYSRSSKDTLYLQKESRLKKSILYLVTDSINYYKLLDWIKNNPHWVVRMDNRDFKCFGLAKCEYLIYFLNGKSDGLGLRIILTKGFSEDDNIEARIHE